MSCRVSSVSDGSTHEREDLVRLDGLACGDETHAVHRLIVLTPSEQSRERVNGPSLRSVTIRDRNEVDRTDLNVRSDWVGQEAELGLVGSGVDVEALAAVSISAAESELFTN